MATIFTKYCKSQVNAEIHISFSNPKLRPPLLNADAQRRTNREGQQTKEGCQIGIFPTRRGTEADETNKSGLAPTISRGALQRKAARQRREGRDRESIQALLPLLSPSPLRRSLLPVRPSVPPRKTALGARSAAALLPPLLCSVSLGVSASSPRSSAIFTPVARERPFKRDRSRCLLSLISPIIQSQFATHQKLKSDSY